MSMSTTMSPPMQSTQHPKYKNKFYVHEGYLKIEVQLYPKIKCQCSSFGVKSYNPKTSKEEFSTINSSNFCKHLWFVLSTVYKIDNQVLDLLHLISNYENLFKSEQNMNKLLSDQIIKHFNNETCGYCLSPLFMNKTVIDGVNNGVNNGICGCDNCGKFVHSKCNAIWIQKNNTCIYCRQEYKTKIK